MTDERLIKTVNDTVNEFLLERGPIEPLREMTRQEEVKLNLIRASGGWKAFFRRKIDEIENNN